MTPEFCGNQHRKLEVTWVTFCNTLLKVVKKFLQKFAQAAKIAATIFFSKHYFFTFLMIAMVY
jgi:hypothetical protein